MEINKTLTIRNRLGLHARAAIKLVELADRFDAEITLKHHDKCANAASVLGLLVLETAQGETIDVQVKGPDAEAALAAVEALIEANFEEE